MKHSRTPPVRGFGVALLVSLLVVPLAGAYEAPQGWLVAAWTALVMLLLFKLGGSRLPWGLLTLVVAAAAIVTPRGALPTIGPALFVATSVCLVAWLANLGPDRTDRDGRPGPGTRERQAQLVMGMSGERHVGQVLARELPDAYVLINGLKLARGAGDIDHVVVGPTGVFLIETKTMAGRILCQSDGTWSRMRIGRGGTAYPAYIGDPAAQVLRNIFATRECLRRRNPGLFRRTPLWIDGLVVFPHPKTDLDVEQSRIPAVRLEAAAAHICLRVPPRGLNPHEVNAVVDTLLSEGNERHERTRDSAQSAQALVEAALALPIVLALLFGTVALSRLIQAQTAVVAIAHEAARAGALGNTPEDAINRMRSRVNLVAPGVGLDPRLVVLDWDVSSFARAGGRVSASVRYMLDFGDLPLAGWIPAPVVRAEHVEWVDPFRGGLGVTDAEAP
jgi:hypothetical protein